MKILAFLQCVWVQDAAAIQRLYANRGTTPEVMVPFLCCPHPAARQGAMPALRQMKLEILRRMEAGKDVAHA